MSSNGQLSQEQEPLDARIRRQVAYYFSVENLSRDRFLFDRMNRSRRVPLDLVASWPRMVQLRRELDREGLEPIVEALQSSAEVTVLVVDDQYMIAPSTPLFDDAHTLRVYFGPEMLSRIESFGCLLNDEDRAGNPIVDATSGALCITYLTRTAVERVMSGILMASSSSGIPIPMEVERRFGPPPRRRNRRRRPAGLRWSNGDDALAPPPPPSAPFQVAPEDFPPLGPQDAKYDPTGPPGPSGWGSIRSSGRGPNGTPGNESNRLPGGKSVGPPATRKCDPVGRGAIRRRPRTSQSSSGHGGCGPIASSGPSRSEPAGPPGCSPVGPSEPDGWVLVGPARLARRASGRGGGANRRGARPSQCSNGHSERGPVATPSGCEPVGLPEPSGSSTVGPAVPTGRGSGRGRGGRGPQTSRGSSGRGRRGSPGRSEDQPNPQEAK